MSISTKDKIIDTSIELFSKNGYAETSMRDIAKNTGIKPGSIYYYFESKENILDYILNEYMEMVTNHKLQHNWNMKKDSVISGEMDISAEKILSFMFFSFDERNAERSKAVMNIICSEAVRNKWVRNYLHQIINSNYQYIKSVLDTLLEANKIPNCNTANLTAVLYSICFAFMHLASIDTYYIGKENEGTNMFSPLKYVLEMVLGDIHE